MACFHPLHGWRNRTPGKNGGFGIVFDHRKSNGQEMSVPCGQCIGCRLDRSQAFAIRCHHEMKHLANLSTFATFTYDDDHLPIGNTLVPEHFQKFMKRFRKKIAPQKVRFFQCGEYGDQFNRPHHHAILFGYTPPDEELHGYSNREPIYTTQFLTDIWKNGQVITGRASFESAAYIARYCTKKINGPQAEDHYWRIDQRTGEAWAVEPEYATMSNRPGIGRNHLDTFTSDIFPSDEVIFEGRSIKPPRYYCEVYRKANPEQWDTIQNRRKENNQKRLKDQTPDRLWQRETVKLAQFDQLKRGYEK